MSIAYRATSINFSFISFLCSPHFLVHLHISASLPLSFPPSIQPSLFCHIDPPPPFLSPLLMPVCCPFSPCQKRSLTTDNLLPFLLPNPFTTFRYCLHASAEESSLPDPFEPLLSSWLSLLPCSFSPWPF